MARTASSYNRTNTRFKPQPTILVICEDSKSGKTYLEDASKHFRVNARVEISHCGKTDPKGIVEEATSYQAKFDQIFCAIDRDAHPNFDEALELCKNSEKIQVITSYPCFEFWLLQHFGYTRKPYTAVGNDSAGHRLIQDLRTKLGMENYDKGDRRSLFNLLLGEKFDFARKTSPILLDQAINEGEMNTQHTATLIDGFLRVAVEASTNINALKQMDSNFFEQNKSPHSRASFLLGCCPSLCDEVQA